MGEQVEVTCPWCGEDLPLWVDRDTSGRFVQDCDVCCRPWQIYVSWEFDPDPDAADEASAAVSVERAY